VEVNMIPIELVDGLVSFIKQVVKEYNLSTKIDGVNKAPSVYAGYLPTDDEDDEDELTPTDYPFVLVRFLSDSDDDDTSNVANIRLIIGTYSEDDQNGWRDALNIATRIKMELKKKQNIGPFSLTNKIQTELFEEQLRPFWHAIMDLSFNVPQVQPDWGGKFE
jgi:hypothetical protein